MSHIDRKIFGLGAFVAAPAVLLSTACDNGKKVDPNPTMPPPVVRTVEGISANPATIVTPRAIEKTATPEPSKNPVNLEPYIDRFGTSIHTVLRNNYKYTYPLIPNADPKIAIPNILGLISDPKTAYIPNSEKRAQITSLYQQALDKDIANPNDPEIPQLILAGSIVFKDECTAGIQKAVMEGSASMINFKNPEYWQDNQFAIIDSNCYWGEKIIIP